MSGSVQCSPDRLEAMESVERKGGYGHVCVMCVYVLCVCMCACAKGRRDEGGVSLFLTLFNFEHHFYMY